MVARAPDRSFRSLSGLEKTASTSRVLNLAAVASQNAGDPDYESSPFFKAAALNGAVIIKHRLRADEQYIFDAAKRISTKVIIPFERTDLGLGGRSLFVGQRGWQELLYQLRGTADEEARDVALLEALDELPSLDPFLLREHLKRRDFKIANCYFAISPADLERMQRFVSGEISKLVDLAYGGGKGGAPNANISKLVSLLLSGQERRAAGAAAPDAGPGGRELPRGDLQLEGLPLLQMGAEQPVAGAARGDLRADRDQGRRPARLRDAEPGQGRGRAGEPGDPGPGAQGPRHAAGL